MKKTPPKKSRSIKSVHKSSRSHLTSTVSDLYVHQKIKAELARKKLGFIDRESNLIRQRAKQKAEALVYKELVIAYKGRVGHKISRTLVSTLTMYLKGKHRNDSHHRSQITQRHNQTIYTVTVYVTSNKTIFTENEKLRCEIYNSHHPTSDCNAFRSKSISEKISVENMDNVLSVVMANICQITVMRM